MILYTWIKVCKVPLTCLVTNTKCNMCDIFNVACRFVGWVQEELGLICYASLQESGRSESMPECR